MPKRKRSRNDDEDDLDYLRHKLKKLERKIRKRCKSRSNSPSDSATPDNASVCSYEAPEVSDPDCWVPPDIAEPEIEISVEPQPKPQDLPEATAISQDCPTPSTSTAVPQGDAPIELDSDVLDILGEDPSVTTKFGPEIRKELVNRLQHAVTEGLNKDTRKELISKYLVPANFVNLDAPKLNIEIKAALAENYIKRDKGIETKQKQMASAISCLGEVISEQLTSKEKNNVMLQKLIDAARMLCDLQHGDSVTRRNFILFSVKKEMKEHLTNTKIDSHLFGENLSETLKSAKAVNKSSVDLKADSGNKNITKKNGKPSGSKPLNRRAPPPPRRLTGTAPASVRSREPAAPRAPPPQPAHSYRTSLQRNPPQRRRY